MGRPSQKAGRWLWVVLLVAAGLPACGGGDGGGGGGGITQPPPPSTVTTTLPTFTFQNVGAGTLAFTDVTVNGTGTLSGTADWTFAANDLDIYATATSCSATNVNNLQSGCAAIGRTTSVSSKPERLTVNVSAGSYRLWIANFGPGAESGTLQLSATVTR